MIQSYTTKLTDKIQLTSNVYLFRFDLLDPKEINFLPGQYLILQIAQNQASVSRLYSIVSPNSEKNSFELLIQIIENGIGSEYFKKLLIGDRVIFKGPAGFFQLKTNEKIKKNIFLVTGTGLAPIRSMILSNLQELDKTEFILFWGLPTYSDVYFLSDFKSLSLKHSNFKFFICLSRESDLTKINEEDRKYFIRGRVNQGYENYLNNVKDNNFQYYVCGSREATESLKQYLSSKNTQNQEIYSEKF